MLNKYKKRVNQKYNMFEKRKTTLQQPEIIRSFVTLPKDFVKKLRWIKGQELYIGLKYSNIIITQRE